MSDLTYHPMSTPHRCVLAVVFLCVITLMIAMMARTMDFQARTAAAVTVDAIAADEDYQPRSPLPLPAGPKRFQELR